MLKQFFTGTLNLRSQLHLLKSMLLVSNTAALLIYLGIHLVFFDLPFEGMTELLTITKMFVIASAFAACISLILVMADAADQLYRQQKAVPLPAYIKGISIAVVGVIVFLSACNSSAAVETKQDSVVTQPAVQTEKAIAPTPAVMLDSATGLRATYTDMQPDKIYLKMNNETLNHNDIPIGESFLLINDGIKGLVVKNGKVTIGCSLQISDSKGKVLLTNPDLFAGKDSFEEQAARTLKCTVPTSEQMQWEEKYTVAVIFWDKNGTGKIENTVIIRAIDMP